MTNGTNGTNGTSGSRGCGEPEMSDSLKAFGEVFKAFRKRAGLTQEQYADLVPYSAQTVAKIEQGRRFPQPDFVERSEEILDAFGALRGAAQHLSRQPGIASWFRQWAKLEAEATSLYTYECRMVPGLLQTEAYARTLFDDQLPPLLDDQIEAQWEARCERQLLLRERPNVAFSFILEEHVLLRQTGGVVFTRGLLDNLLAVAALRNIEIQVMPLVREHHSGLHGPMRLLETPENRWFGYCEGQESGQFISDRKLVSTLQMRYARMRAQALGLEDSVRLLRRLRGAT